MHYLFSVIDDATQTASEDEMAAIDAFNQRLRDAGHWVLAGGVEAPGKATVIDARAESLTLTPGPAHAGASFTAGFWVIEAMDRDEAHDLAQQASRACNRVIEVRAFLR